MARSEKEFGRDDEEVFDLLGLKALAEQILPSSFI